MARMARVVAPGMPHHITQRGNRRQQTFFADDDYQAYIDLMAEWCGTYDVEIWAYCLMPNHIHLIAVPPEHENLIWPLVRPIAGIPVLSISQKAVKATSGRAVLRHIF